MAIRHCESGQYGTCGRFLLVSAGFECLHSGKAALWKGGAVVVAAEHALCATKVLRGHFECIGQRMHSFVLEHSASQNVPKQAQATPYSRTACPLDLKPWDIANTPGARFAGANHARSGGMFLHAWGSAGQHPNLRTPVVTGVAPAQTLAALGMSGMSQMSHVKQCRRESSPRQRPTSVNYILHFIQAKRHT